MGYLDSADGENQQSTAFGNQYGGDVFADVNNLDHCIKYLNQSLTTFGFPSTLHLSSNDPASVVQTCNCIYALLQQRQRDIEFRDAANDQKHRLMSDMTRLEAKLERQEAQLFAKERELAALTSKEQKAAAAFKAQLEKLQQERDEFQRMVVSTQQVRVQQSHELKKKEKEYAKLQEKLNQVLAEKKKETKPGLEILTLLQKEGRQRGTWNSKKADGDFTKMIVDAYEAKKQELMAENTDLRSLLRSMQCDMRDFLNTPNGMGKASSVNGSFDGDRPSTPLAGRTDVFDLPFHMARDQIEQSLRTKMSSIKERMMQLQESQQALKISKEASDRELELEAQLVEARSIINEQVSLMNKQLAEDCRTPTTLHRTGKLSPASEEADEETVASDGWRVQLDAERSAIKKMTADLERDRLEVEKAKERLQRGEEEQASWAKSMNLWAVQVDGAKDLPEKNDIRPKDQNAIAEVANTGLEVLNQAENQRSSLGAQTDWLRMHVDLLEAQATRLESLDVPAENQARFQDLPYSPSRGQRVPINTENESTPAADPPRDRKSRRCSEKQRRHQDKSESDDTSCISDPQRAEILWKESSKRRGNSFRTRGKLLISQESGSVGRSARLSDPSYAVVDSSRHPEFETSRPELRDNSRSSRRRTASRNESSAEMGNHESGRVVGRTQSARAASHEIKRSESVSMLTGKQVEYQRSAVNGISRDPETAKAQLTEREFNPRSHRRSISLGQNSADVARISHKRARSRGENFSELTRYRSSRQAEQDETSKGFPDEIHRSESQRSLAGKQVESSSKRLEQLRSESRSRGNSEQRVPPGFRHIPDDAWVDDSQSMQTATSEQETQRISLKGVQSERSQFSSRVEPRRVGEPAERSSGLMDVPPAFSGNKKKRKLELISCGCLRVFKNSTE
ncbi:hypothetical protein R1flu_011298 [Riccia fluitans]|uniref:Afadin-and alpha-actinin-binding protein n=1 Tax=Riccia fluitans TaxID=41844 RepID=A0ABD1Z7S2_9MARC